MKLYLIFLLTMITISVAENTDIKRLEQSILNLEGRLLNFDTRLMYLEQRYMGTNLPNLPLRSPSALNRVRESTGRRERKSSDVDRNNPQTVPPLTPFKPIHRDGDGYFTISHE